MDDSLFYIVLRFNAQEQERVCTKHIVGRKIKVHFTLEQATKARGEGVEI